MSDSLSLFLQLTAPLVQTTVPPHQVNPARLFWVGVAVAMRLATDFAAAFMLVLVTSMTCGSTDQPTLSAHT